MAEHDVEAVWQDFWKDIVCEESLPGDESDVVNLEQLKRELYDYWQFMATWSEVAYLFSDGQLSKVNYTADVYIQAFSANVDRIVEERVAEEIEDGELFTRSELNQIIGYFSAAIPELWNIEIPSLADKLEVAIDAIRNPIAETPLED